MRRTLLAALAVAALAASAQAQTVTPRAGVATTLSSTGATTIISGPVTGCYVANPLTAANQGISAAEPIYLDPVAPATLVGNGTTIVIAAGATWTCPPNSSATVTAIAPTGFHKITVVRW